MPCFLVAGRASRGASAAAMDASGAAAAESQDADGATAADAGSEPASAFVLSQDPDNAAGSAAASALIAAGFTAEKSSSAGTGATSLAGIHFHVLAGLHWFRDQHVQTGNGAAQTDEQNHIREINADGDGGRSEGEVRQNIEYNADDRKSAGVTVLEDALPVLERTARQDCVRAVHEAVHVQETAERERQEGHQKSDHQIRQTEINGREIEDSPNRADDHADRGQEAEHQRRRVGIPTLARAGQGTKITPCHKKARQILFHKVRVLSSSDKIRS